MPLGYMFKAAMETPEQREICSELIIKTPEIDVGLVHLYFTYCSGVSVVNLNK